MIRENADKNEVWRVRRSRSSPTQTTRKVHRLSAILLRRWQAEEIAKTPLARVSRIWIKHKIQMDQIRNCLVMKSVKTSSVESRSA